MIAIKMIHFSIFKFLFKNIQYSYITKMDLSEDVKYHIWKSYFSHHVNKELLTVVPKTLDNNSWLPIACRVDWLKRKYFDDIIKECTSNR
jgi:hypothetical protein